MQGMNSETRRILVEIKGNKQNYQKVLNYVKCTLKE